MGQPGKHGEEWFTEIYAAHYPLVVKYGLRRLADLDASVELAQDVFTIAWRRRAEVPDHSLPWLYGVARRLLANHWRARRTGPEVSSITNLDLLPDAAEPDAAATLADVRAALATLGEPDQEILRLIAWEELTTGEAAAVLGCTRTAAKVRLHRARRRLAAALTAPRATTVTPGRKLAQLRKEP
jgi:RNA polymerase sigma factor (sigma-70 family)